MTICKQCGGHMSDLGEHFCPMTQPYRMPPVTYRPLTSPFPTIVKGQKCDICGSTAIDHTEAQCIINRQLKALQNQSGEDGE